MGERDQRATGGTYTLLIELTTNTSVSFGAAGVRDLDAGWFAYTGSALGPGGFARVERHRELAAGERDARHWHVDYLLGHPHATLVDDVRSAGVEAECGVARTVATADDPEPVPGVGATDCDCGSHMAYVPDRSALERTVRRAHRLVRD